MFSHDDTRPTLSPVTEPVAGQKDGQARQSPSGSPIFRFLLPPVESDEIGRLGNYRVLRFLKKGGMGYVFHAEDADLRRPVALKVMSPDLKGQWDGAERFLREAQLMAKIKHKHLVTIYQAGKEGDVAYFAMELLQGEPLQAWMERVPQPPLHEVLRIGREIASGLVVLHGKNLIHRDIKPDNIWLEAPNGRVKILDLGLARPVHQTDLVTAAGTIMGTPGFMSPEQARGDAVDARSDLFSLGCVLYALCTGQRPFKKDNLMAELTALAVNKPQSPIELNPGVPEGLSSLVMQLLDKSPQSRPESAEAVRKKLDGIKRGSTPPATLTQRSPVRRDRETRKKDRSQPTKSRSSLSPYWIGAGAVGAVAAFAFLIGLVIQLARPPKPPDAGPVDRAAVKVPKAAVADPNAAVAELKSAGADPKAAVADLKAAVADPKAAVGDPKAAVADPKAAVADPKASATGPKTPLVEPKAAKAEPREKEKTFLTDMKIAAKENWPFELPDHPPGKGPHPMLAVKGKSLKHGIFMHPPIPPLEGKPASLSFKLGRAFQTFNAAVSINDGPDSSFTPCTFRVYGDGKLLWESKKVSTQNDTQKCTVRTASVDVLKIAVICPGPPMGAHAVWMDPYVEK